MSIERTQPHPEAQRELRFTARDPILDEALAMLEAPQYRQSDTFPRNLFLYSMKRLAIDTSDTYDGHSRNKFDFEQYRHRIKQTASARGYQKFALDPFLKPIRLEGLDSPVVGVGVRIRPPGHIARELIAPPFYGEAEQAAGYIPAYYRMDRPQTGEQLDEALDRLERVMKLGVWVSQLTIVPSVPVAARRADVFLHEPMKRTYTYVDEALSHEPPTPPPVDITSRRFNQHGKPSGDGQSLLATNR